MSAAGSSVKSAVLVINTISDQTYSRHSVVSLKKTLNDTFPCLAVLASGFKFQSNLYKTKKPKKKKKLQPDSNILPSPEVGRGNFVLGPRCVPANQEDKYRDKLKKKVAGGPPVH